MTQYLAAVHDPDSLLSRRARPEVTSTGSPSARSAEAPQDPSPGPAPPALDADMLDLVTKFEQNFAELAPTRPEPQHAPLTDDLFPEFPEQPFDSTPPRQRPRALELARFEPREPLRAAPLRAEVRPVLTDEQLDIDEAFSILRAAESRGAEMAQQAAEGPRSAAAEQPLPRPDVEPALRPRASGNEPPFERTDWSSRSHRPRSIAVVAGVLVLALGLTAGYVAGRSPHGKSHGLVQVTQQGGTVLKLDSNLPKR